MVEGSGGMEVLGDIYSWEGCYNHCEEGNGKGFFRGWGVEWMGLLDIDQFVVSERSSTL